MKSFLTLLILAPSFFFLSSCNKKSAVSGEVTAMATLLEGKVSAFEGGDYELTNLRAAEYYIVYVSASY